MKEMVLRNLWWIAFGVAFILLIDHSLKIVNLTVDTTSILLLIVMLLSPFVAAVKKIKFGEFEAEIDINEIRKIKSETEKTLNETQETREEQAEIYSTSNTIKALAESDPVIALAKIRIELEKVLGQLARFNSITVRNLSLGIIVNKLTNQEIINHDIGKALREVIALCNRAIHGESLSEEGARAIVDVGINLLEELYWLAITQASDGTVVLEEIITPEQSDDYYHSKRYRLTSIKPYVEHPKKVVRELTQEQLNEVLQGYEEHAEFIVELVEIKNN
ncbi:hypothetical protein [Aeromonas veronii]|uniref:hypothetical protein n=1 Tax=Aeromonas veronii TaxID=654 RepID=UPI001FD6A683|nr:hypothetical protein [Aeromonas veronii]MCJ8219300.1 hypothetical protein [Aeromonas veronii]